MDEYDRKFNELQKYVQFLEQVIEKLKKGGKSRESELERIQTLYRIITNKNKKCKIETLLKCETVLITLHSNWEKRATTNEQGKSETCEETSAPASPQENWDKSVESYKTPIVIPTERKFDYFERGSNVRSNYRDWNHSLYNNRNESPRDDRELYRRRSPSRYSGNQYQSSSSRHMYDQLQTTYTGNISDSYRKDRHNLDSADVYESHSRHTENSYRFKDSRKFSPHTITSEQNELMRGNYEDNNVSGPSIFNRLGNKLDVNSTHSYENFKVKISNEKSRSNHPPQPIADVLKSPPLSLNDINDLMNESNEDDKKEKSGRNRIGTGSNDDWKSLRDLELARKKLIKIDVSSDARKRNNSPKLFSEKKVDHKSPARNEDSDKLIEKCDQSKSKTKLLEKKSETVTRKSELLQNKLESSSKISTEISKPSTSSKISTEISKPSTDSVQNQTENDKNIERLAYKYNPHRRKNSDSSQRNDLPEKQSSKSPSTPSDFRNNVPSHSTLPSVSPSDPRLKSRSFENAISQIPSRTIPSLLDIPPVNPFTTNLTTMPVKDPRSFTKDLDRNFLNKNIPPSTQTPVTTNIATSSYKGPATLLPNPIETSINYGKFRPTWNDQVERMKYFKSKRNKNEPQTYKEHRRAKIEAERIKEFKTEKRKDKEAKLSDTTKNLDEKAEQPQKNVLDSMYTNSDWHGESSHISSNFKIPKINKNDDKTYEKDKVDKNQKEEKLSSSLTFENKTTRDERNPEIESIPKSVIDEDENWDDIDVNQEKEEEEKVKPKECHSNEIKRSDKKSHKKQKEKKKKGEEHNLEQKQSKKEKLEVVDKSKESKDENVINVNQIHELKENNSVVENSENYNVVDTNSNTTSLTDTVVVENTSEEEKRKLQRNEDSESKQNKEDMLQQINDDNTSLDKKSNHTKKLMINLPKIRQRRQSIPSYVYIEVLEGELNDDKTVISTKNIIEGKRERKTRTSLSTERKQSLSPATSSKSAKSSPTIPKLQPNINKKKSSIKSEKKKTKKDTINKNLREELDLCETTSADKTEKKIKTEIENKDQECVISSSTSTQIEKLTTPSNAENNSKEDKKEEDTLRVKTPSLEASALVNLLNPSLLNTECVLGLLERVLDKDKFLPIKQILEKSDNDENTIKTETKTNQNEKDDDKSKTQKAKPHKTELDRLNEDIRDMFICKDVINATGRRMCTINAEKKQNETSKQKEIVTPTAPKQKIGPKSKMQKLNRIQKNKKLNNFKKFVKLDKEVLKSIEIKQPRVSIRKECLKKLKKSIKLEMLSDDATTSIVKNEDDSKNKNDNDEEINDIMMPKLEPCTSIEDVFNSTVVPLEQEENDIKLSKKILKNKPCPKSKKKFYEESDDEIGIDSNILVEHDDKNSTKENELEQETVVHKNVNKLKCGKGRKRGRLQTTLTNETIKNTNSDMHSQSIYTEKCVLCGANTGKPNHYVIHHLNREVFVSRLPPDTLINLKQNQNSKIAIRNRKYKSNTYEHQCPFCDCIKSISKEMWHNHIGIHTGEYGYQCTGCKRTFTVLPAARSHVKLHCKSAQTINIRQLDVENKKNIIANLCDICNYVQMDEKNIIKHLKTEHNIHDEDFLKRNISQLTLFEFEEVPNKNDTSLKKRKKKSMTTDQRQNENENNTKNINEKNIEAFLPKENVDFNLDKNFLKYMSEISFKSSTDIPKQKSSTTSIVDQLSKKINSNQNSNIDNMFGHSIFNDMLITDDSLSEKFKKSDNNLQENKELNKNIIDSSLSLEENSNRNLKENVQKKPLLNDPLLKSWEKRYSQQISDGGISLANEFNKNILNNEMSSLFVDKISQRLSKTMSDNETNSNEILKPSEITSTTEKEKENASVLDFITIKDDDDDDDDNNKNNEDPLKLTNKECEENTKDPLKVEGISVLENSTNFDSSFEDRLVIDENDYESTQSSTSTVTYDLSEKQKLKLSEIKQDNNDDEQQNKTKIQNENNCDDIIIDGDEDDEEEEEEEEDYDDDDDNWEDIEEIITAEKNPTTTKSSKNKTMFQTLSRLYTSIIPTKSIKINTASKNEQKSADNKKSNKQSSKITESIKTGTSLSKSGIFQLPKSSCKDTKNNPIKETPFESCVPGVQYDDILPDKIFSDEVGELEDNANQLTNATTNVIQSSEIVSSVMNENVQTSISIPKSSNETLKPTNSDKVQNLKNSKNSDKNPEVMEKDKPSTSVQKICNIGFNKMSDDDIRYRCLIDNCSFLYSNSPAGLEVHFKFEHNNIKWNGYCHCCESAIFSDSNIPLSKELNHLIDVHLKKSSQMSSPVLSPSLLCDENSSSSKNSDGKQLLKIRRLSGDKLSSNCSSLKMKDNLLAEQSNEFKILNQECSSKVTSPTKIFYFTPEDIQKELSITNPTKQLKSIKSTTTYTNPKQKLLIIQKQQQPIAMKPPLPFKITKVESLGFGEEIEKITRISKEPKLSSAPQLTQKNNLLKLLKPWLKKSISTKSLSNIKALLEEKSLYCLYKCMGENCEFRSQTFVKMKNHLNIHSLTALETPSTSTSTLRIHQAYLECPYCDMILNNNEIYLNHMKIHSKDIYQCPYCFYRSCVKSNVIIHLKNYHSNNEIKIILCIGEPRLALDYENQSLIAQRNKYVIPIPCSDCPEIFLKIDLYEIHVKQHEHNKTHYMCGICKKFFPTTELKSHLHKNHSIALYDCIYCSYASNTNYEMKNHLSQEHPSCLAFTFIRKNMQEHSLTVEPNKRQTIFISLSEKVDENLLRPCHYTEEQLDTEPATTTLKHNSTSVVTYVKKTIKPLLKSSINTESVSDKSNLSTHDDTINQNNVEQIKNRTDMNITSTLTATELSSSSSSLSNLNYVENKSIEEDINSSNTEITGNTLMERIEKAAKEAVKDTGLDGEQLYKCGFIGCTETIPDAIKFSDHIFKHSSANFDFKCYHCNQILKSVSELRSHIRIHAMHRYFCYFCNYTSAIPNMLSKHMNTSHSRTQFLTYPLISGKHDKAKDFFVVCPKNIQPIEIVQYGERMIRTIERKKALEKRHFTPEEINKLPRQPIFFEELYCAVCNYKTKVRTNMLRHLDDHKNAVNVANVDPVNPVPCLNTNEKHFDKMVNLALSSNITKDGGKTSNLCTTKPDIKLPEFVLESRRYVCGVPECTYLTINEGMLKFHLNALHITEKSYTCPHCQYEVCKRGILVDKVIQHLKYHDVKLFVCDKCQYMHYQKNVVERHISDKHPMEDVICNCYERNVNDVFKITTTIPARAYPSASTSSSGQDSKQSNSDLKWECSICKGKTLTYNQMISHVNKKHGIKYRFKCEHCEFGANSFASVEDHIATRHPTKVKEIRFMFYKISEHTKTKQQRDTTPLWTRDPSKVKNIRGILMEEDEEPQYGMNLNYVAVSHDDFENDIEMTTVKAKTAKPKPRARAMSTFISSSPAQSSLSSLPMAAPSSLPITVSIKPKEALNLAYKPKPRERAKSTSSRSSSLLVTSSIPSLPGPSHTNVSSSKQTITQLKPEDALNLISSKKLLKPIDLNIASKIFKEPFYSCDRCAYLAETEAGLENHKKSFDHISLFMNLDKNLIFFCSTCLYTTKNVENLSEHWRNKHWSGKIVNNNSILTPDVPYWFKISTQVKCARCDYQGSSSEAAKHHEIQHSEMTLALIDIKIPNQCSQCLFEFNNNNLNLLSQHFIRCHQFLDNPVKHVNTNFLQIILKLGQIQRYIHCLICNSIFIDKYNYIHHHGQIHNEQNYKYEILKNVILYRCPNCPFTTVNESEQYSHLIKHNRSLLQTCTICKKKFISYDLFKNHIEAEHVNYDLHSNQMYYYNANIRLYEKMKIIFPNGFVLEKHQAKLTEYGSMNITTETSLNNANNHKNDNKNLVNNNVTQDSEISNNTTLLSNGKSVSIINRSLLNKTVLKSNLPSKTLNSTKRKIIFKNVDFDNSQMQTQKKPHASKQYNSDDDEPKQKGINKLLMKRRKSVAGTCYTGNSFENGNNDDDDDDDDKNDLDWSLPSTNSKTYSKLKNKNKQIDKINVEQLEPYSYGKISNKIDLSKINTTIENKDDNDDNTTKITNEDFAKMYNTQTKKRKSSSSSSSLILIDDDDDDDNDCNVSCEKRIRIEKNKK